MAIVPDRELCGYGEYRIMYDEYDPVTEDRQLVIYRGDPPTGPEWLGPGVVESEEGGVRYFSVRDTDLRDTSPHRLLRRYVQSLGEAG